MLSVFQTDILFRELIQRLVSSAFTGGLWLLLGLGVLAVFRINNPAVKHIIYTIVLFKGFVALIREQTPAVHSRGTLSIGLQFPNPSLLPDMPSEVGTSFFRTNSSIAFGPGIVVLTAALIFLLWRFLAFLRFQRMVKAAPEIDRASNPGFFAILDPLVEQAQVAYPRIILVNSSEAPFTVGAKQPVIAFSAILLEQLANDEVEAVLAHEIAHIARRDHLCHWPIVIMRDVLFFSPLTYFIYRRLSFERERACDDFSSRLCRPLTLAKSLVKIAELGQAEPAPGTIRSFAPQSFISKKEYYFSRRVIELLEPRPYPQPSWRQQLLFWLGAFMFLWAEIHISAFISNTQFILA